MFNSTDLRQHKSVIKLNANGVVTTEGSTSSIIYASAITANLLASKASAEGQQDLYGILQDYEWTMMQSAKLKLDFTAVKGVSGEIACVFLPPAVEMPTDPQQLLNLAIMRRGQPSTVFKKFSDWAGKKHIIQVPITPGKARPNDILFHFYIIVTTQLLVTQLPIKTGDAPTSSSTPSVSSSLFTGPIADIYLMSVLNFAFKSPHPSRSTHSLKVQEFSQVQAPIGARGSYFAMPMVSSLTPDQAQGMANSSELPAGSNGVLYAPIGFTDEFMPIEIGPVFSAALSLIDAATGIPILTPLFRAASVAVTAVGTFFGLETDGYSTVPVAESKSRAYASADGLPNGLPPANSTGVFSGIATDAPTGLSSDHLPWNVMLSALVNQYYNNGGDQQRTIYNIIYACIAAGMYPNLLISYNNNLNTVSSTGTYIQPFNNANGTPYAPFTGVYADPTGDGASLIAPLS